MVSYIKLCDTADSIVSDLKELKDLFSSPVLEEERECLEPKVTDCATCLVAFAPIGIRKNG